MTAGYLGFCGLLEQAITAGRTCNRSCCCEHDGWSAVKSGNGATRSVLVRRANLRLRHCLLLTAAVWHDCHGRERSGLRRSSSSHNTKARSRPSGPKRLVAPLITAKLDSGAGWVYSAGTLHCSTGSFRSDLNECGGWHPSTTAQRVGAANCPCESQNRALAGVAPRWGRGPRPTSKSDTRLLLEAQAMPNGKQTQRAQ
jgi:hypothetical protein